MAGVLGDHSKCSAHPAVSYPAGESSSSFVFILISCVPILIYQNRGSSTLCRDIVRLEAMLSGCVYLWIRIFAIKPKNVIIFLRSKFLALSSLGRSPMGEANG